MNNGPAPEISGRQLVADFQSALLALATREAARYEAERTETELLQNLNAVSQGSYLNPDAISHNLQEQIAHESMDAHIKKVQARQIDSLSIAQLHQLASEDQQRYTGKKVRITVTDASAQPVEALWFDQRNGYRANPIQKRNIEGTIQEIVLDKNALFIRPHWSRRLMNSNLHNYIIYVINPLNMEPAVSIELK